jgi:hypothetical protein
MTNEYIKGEAVGARGKEPSRLSERAQTMNTRSDDKNVEQLPPLSEFQWYRQFYDKLTKLLRAAEGDDLLEVVAEIIRRRDAALSAIREIGERDAALEEAMQCCRDEYLNDKTGTPEDAAYDAAVSHCIGAIRAIKGMSIPLREAELPAGSILNGGQRANSTVTASHQSEDYKRGYQAGYEAALEGQRD